MQKQNRQFAYGEDTVDNCQCPSTRAGWNPGKVGAKPDPNAGFTQVADQYDTYVRIALYEADGGDVSKLPDPPSLRLQEKGYTEGVIDEDMARECWIKATEVMDTDSAHDAGVMVASELGWMDGFDWWVKTND